MSLLASGNVDPGRLDRRVELHYPISSRDALGGSGSVWIVAASVWAEKQFMRGGRMFAAEGKSYESALIYRIRHRDDVSEGWRLVHGDDVFEIVSVEGSGRGHFLTLAVRGINQDAGTALRTLMTHDQAPFLLHASDSHLLLHREQDAA